MLCAADGNTRAAVRAQERALAAGFSMHFLVYKDTIHSEDMMAQGHHFLTNFKLQCRASETALFLQELDGPDTWMKQPAALELRTQQGYARNLSPLLLGQRVAVLVSCDEVGLDSFRLCFRVVSAQGQPVTCGYQVILVLNKADRRATRIPDILRHRLDLIREPEGRNVARSILRGAKALEQLFPVGLCAAAGGIARGGTPLPPRSLLPFGAIGQVRDESRLALVCPGQESYDRQLLRQAGISLPWLAQLVAEVEELAADALKVPLGFLAEQEVGEDRRTRLYRNQLGSFLEAYALGQRLMQERGQPALVLGYSAGEIAALALSGMLDPLTGARIILARTRALLENAPHGTGHRTVEAPREDLLPLLEDGKAGSVAIANRWRQVVIAGTDEQLETFAIRAAANGMTSRRLPSAFAYHSALLLPAVAPFAQALQGLSWAPADIPVLSPMERTQWRQDWHLPSVLASHLIRPLDFSAAVEDLARKGQWTFVGCGRLGRIGQVIRHIVEPHCMTREAFPAAWG